MGKSDMCVSCSFSSETLFTDGTVAVNCLEDIGVDKIFFNLLLQILHVGKVLFLP